MAGPRHRSWVGLVYADFPRPYHSRLFGTAPMVSEKRCSGGQGRYGAGGNLAGFVRPSGAGEVSTTVSTPCPTGGDVHWRFERVSTDRLPFGRVCVRSARKPGCPPPHR